MKPILAGYLLLGVAVAAALWRCLSGGPRDRLGPSAWHVVAWPFFVPVLMATQQEGMGGPDDDPIGEMERRLLRATELLARQLRHPLGLERARVRALGAAMRATSARAEALQAVLLQPGYDGAALAVQRDTARSGADALAAPLVPVLDARLGNVERVRALWLQARSDLELALARAAELEGRLTVLRFEASGPATTAATRAREAAEAIDELSRLLREVRAEG